MTAIKREEYIGGQRLILGDCLDVMPELGRFDAVVTDPPYGLGQSQTDKNKYTSFSDDEQEVETLVSRVLALARSDRIVMTPGQKMMFRYKEPDAVGAIYYPAGTGSCAWGFVGWQPIFYYGKDPFLEDGKGRHANSFASTESAEKNGHPCPKPVRQWSKIVKRVTRDAETILDPFMGSGTTLVACQKLGRRGTGIEIDPDYWTIACERVHKAWCEPDLFIKDAIDTKPHQERLFDE